MRRSRRRRPRTSPGWYRPRTRTRMACGPAFCCRRLPNESRNSRARFVSPVSRAMTVLVPYRRTSRLSSPSFARTRAANSYGFAAASAGKSGVPSWTFKSSAGSGAGNHLVQQIAARQQVQHLAHRRGSIVHDADVHQLRQRRLLAAPSGSAASCRARRRSSGSGLRMASTLKTNASAAASGAEPAGTFA